VLELSDRRASHLLDVVRVAVGSRIRVGLVDGDVGHGEVLAAGDRRCTLRVVLDRPPPPQLPVHLLLAIPRPKVLLRTLAIAASFGVERIDLTNSWRVDKSYLGSPVLAAESIARALRDGAEQGATSRLPVVSVHKRFMAMLDAYPDVPPHLPAARDPSRHYVVAHPGVEVSIEAVARPGDRRPLTVAIGPEGGWIQRELDTFERRGFTAASMGASILRVEAAIASLLGQVQLLRRMSAVS
jgi:16S rRNA (uracil1498-N3)-methyltransferase